jgi:hypothetical protein
LLLCRKKEIAAVQQSFISVLQNAAGVLRPG